MAAYVKPLPKMSQDFTREETREKYRKKIDQDAENIELPFVVWLATMSALVGCGLIAVNIFNLLQ